VIISVITATTFVVQIIDPICVKVAVGRAGEIGMASLEYNGWAPEGTPEGLDLLPSTTHERSSEDRHVTRRAKRTAGRAK
jgi:hypothetical protein